MLNTIVAISGKPGLYKLVSRGNRMLVVESLEDSKKRVPVYANDKVISLADISMYTEEDDMPLRDVLNALKTKQNGSVVELDIKKASKEELFDFFGTFVPNFDRDRVYPNDVKKLITWYNLLVTSGNDDFDSDMTPTEGDNIDNRKEQE
jgi:dephospho-CoA kinase